MAIKFATKETNHGLDVTANPPQIMVPVNGERKVIVTGMSGHMPIKTSPVLPGFAKAGFSFSQNGEGDCRTLTIRGSQAGLGAIEFMDGALDDTTQMARWLRVAVKDRKEIQAVFHYVDDGNKQVTKRKPTDLPKLLTKVNAIIAPQTNIWVLCKSWKHLKPGIELGSTVYQKKGYTGSKTKFKEYSYLKGLGDPKAQLNVYFVRRYETIFGDGADTEASATVNGNHMIMEDKVDVDEETFAHEIMHHLGLRHGDALADNNLNQSGLKRDGTFIPAKLGDEINKIKKPAKTINPFGGP